MVNFYILKKCLVYWRFERITRNCRKYDIRLLCVEFIRWQCACKQRACNARDKWDLLTSFFHVKSYGYIFLLKCKCSVRFVRCTGPRSSQGRLMQTAERFSFSFHLIFFMIIKNIPKSICLPRTLRPDI